MHCCCGRDFLQISEIIGDNVQNCRILEDNKKKYNRLSRLAEPKRINIVLAQKSTISNVAKRIKIIDKTDRAFDTRTEQLAFPKIRYNRFIARK